MTMFSYITRFYRYGFIITLALVSFQGCVNIKASLPAYSYYTLESTETQGYNHTTFSTIALELEVLPYLNTQRIMRISPQAKAQALTTTKWITLPSLLLQNTLESNARMQGVILSTLGAHPIKLHIKVRKLAIYEESKQAIVALDYTLLQGQSISRVRTLLSVENVQNSNEQAMINALQSALDSAAKKIQNALCDDTKLCTSPKATPH